MSLAKRAAVSPDQEANSAGEIGSLRLFSNRCNAAAVAVGISCNLMGARKSREMPIRPTTFPAASRSGNFVVRHQHG